jgi:hypothetical protein
MGAEHHTLVARDITSRREAEARDREHQAQLAHVSRVSLAVKWPQDWRMS